MCGAVLAGQQGEEGVLQEHRDPISHWLPELCAHICYLSGPGLGFWVLALSCWLCPGRGGRRRLGGGGSCLPACVSGRGCCLGVSEGGSHACFQTLRRGVCTSVCTHEAARLAGIQASTVYRRWAACPGAAGWGGSLAAFWSCVWSQGVMVSETVSVGCCGWECPETQGCVSTGSCTARVLGGGSGVLPGRSCVSLRAVSGPPRGCPVFRVTTHTSSVVRPCRVL